MDRDRTDFKQRKEKEINNFGKECLLMIVEPLYWNQTLNVDTSIIKTRYWHWDRDFNKTLLNLLFIKPP